MVVCNRRPQWRRNCWNNLCKRIPKNKSEFRVEKVPKKMVTN